MKLNLSKAILIACITLIAGSSHAGAKMRAADAAMEPAPDPKKKKPGEECKTSDECQRHHSCKKDGDKGVCTAPPRHKIPPGAVT
mgnify:CR=1 FL=1